MNKRNEESEKVTQRRIAKKMDSELEKKKRKRKRKKELLQNKEKNEQKKQETKSRKAKKFTEYFTVDPLSCIYVCICIAVTYLSSICIIHLFLFLGFSFICASSILLIIINHRKPFPPTPYIQPRSHLQPYSNIHKALKIR